MHLPGDEIYYQQKLNFLDKVEASFHLGAKSVSADNMG